MKRSITFILALVVFMALSMGICVNAADSVYEGFTYYISGDSAIIKKVDEQMSGNVVIPSEIEGKEVKTIGSSAFKGRDKITSLTIPDGVGKIEYDAFKNCTGLTELVIPDSVTEIGNGVFSGCDNITIVGNEGSYAQEYCEKNNIPFKVTGHLKTTVQETVDEKMNDITLGSYQGTYTLTGTGLREGKRGLIIQIREKKTEKYAQFISYPLDTNDENEAYEYSMSIQYDTKNKSYKFIGLSESDEYEAASEMFGSLLTNSVDNMYDLQITKLGETITGKVFGTYTPGIFSFYGEIGSFEVTYTDNPEIPEIDKGDFDSILGTYSGTYTATQGVTGGILTIEKKNNEYVAKFEFYPTDGNADVESGSYKMDIKYNSRTKKYEFTGTQWIDKAPTYEFANFIGQFKNDVCEGDVYNPSGNRTGTFKFTMSDGIGEMKVLTDRPDLSLFVGESMQICVQLYDDNGKQVNNISNIAINIENSSVAKNGERKDEAGNRYFTINAVGVGETKISVINKNTGEKCTFKLKVQQLGKNAYTIYNVPSIRVEEDYVNFYNFSGLYIDSYKYNLYDNGSCDVSFDIYNTNSIYGMVEVYDKDGNLYSCKTINKFTSNVTGLVDAFWSKPKELFVDISNRNFGTYRQVFGCSKKTSISVTVPQGGYIKITVDPNSSLAVALVNSLDIMLKTDSINRSANKSPSDEYEWTDNFIENVRIATRGEIFRAGKSEEYSQELMSGYTKKVFLSGKGAGIIWNSTSEFISSLKLEDVLIQSLNVTLGITEKISKKLMGPYGEILDGMFFGAKYANLINQLMDIISCENSGGITMQVPEDARRSCAGITVESSYVLDNNIALDAYVIPRSSEEIKQLQLNNNRLDLEDVIFFNMSLANADKEIQPKSDVKVSVQIPDSKLNVLNKLKIYRCENDGTLTDMNASVNENKLTFNTNHFSIYILAEEKDGVVTSFNSMVSEWAKDEIEEAYKANIIPEELIGEDLTKKADRAEFAAIAVKMYENLSGKQTSSAVNPFNDINDNKYKEDILKAYSLNITLGTGADKFTPDDNITREQMAAMLTRAYKKSEFESWNIESDDKYPLNYMGVQKFNDDNEISDYAKEAVYFMVRWNVIQGVGDNMFAPKGGIGLGEGYGYATREQALVIALRSTKYLNQ